MHISLPGSDAVTVKERCSVYCACWLIGYSLNRSVAGLKLICLFSM